MNFWGPLGVAQFELRRSFSAGRWALWLLISLFPVLLATVTWIRTEGTTPDDVMVVVLFFLIVRVACVMGLLLWATPVINSEMEGRTWIYAATRPSGNTSLVLGKFLVAVLWSLTAGIVATTLAVPASGIGDPLWTWWVLTVLVCFAVVAYGALFTLIGTLLQRRAMVVAILYIVMIEGALSLVPATINRFTVGYRLLSLLVDWMNLDEGAESEQYEMLFTSTTATTHIAILLLYSLGVMTAALLRARHGGYLTDPED